jgi:AraC-like DNA-binding protein
MVCRHQGARLGELRINQNSRSIPLESLEERVGEPPGAPLLPPECGSGRIRVDVLNSGIIIGEVETHGAREALSCRAELVEPMYAITFHLQEKRSSFRFQGIREPLVVRLGDTNLLTPRRTCTMNIPRGGSCHEFSLLITPEAAEELFEGGGAEGWDEAQGLLAAGQNQVVISSSLWTPAMSLAVEQIRVCPYAGALREMFLESKALELIVLRLDAVLRSDSKDTLPPPLTEREQKMLMEARGILEASMKDPPTIGELARMVGTNATKLKSGFRQLFGACVFEHLRHYRMEHALTLLQDEGMNVTEVAFTVGYSSVSAFSAAFHRTFGITPTTARLSSVRRDRRNWSH